MKSKLVFLYIISAFLVLIIIVLAVLNLNENKKIELEKEEGDEINFESINKIQLLRREKGQIEETDLNYYLLCVVASEIPFKYEYEAIKAQTVVARTYLFNKILNNLEEQGDVCDDYRHCQAFNDITNLENIWKQKGYTEDEIKEGKDKIKKAIIETQDEVITYDGKIIDALFHASSPEKTEDAKAIWSCQDVPYLRAVENTEEESYENRTSKVTISYATFKNTLIDKGYIDDLTINEFLNIYIDEYTESGRVKNIKVGNCSIKAEDLRPIFNIKSTKFNININENNIEFDVLGYGHGVGLSQVGANTYAKAGKTYDEIIHHYYTNVSIVNGYDIQKKRGEV